MTTTDLSNNNNQSPQGGQTPSQQEDLTAQQQQQQQGQTPPTSQQTPPTNHSQLTDHWTEKDREYMKQLRNEAEAANDKAKAALAQVDAIAREKAKAEQERLKQQGEYKQLAEQHEAKVKELEPIANRYTDLAKLISEQIETEIKDWPKVVKTLDPGTDAPVEQRLAWRNNARAIVLEIANTQRGQAPGNGQNPPAVGGNQQSQAGVNDLYERLKAQRGPAF